MKRFVLLTAALVAAASASAKDVLINLDTSSAQRAFFSHGVIPVGYSTDPKIGGEEAALACRRAGAWIFHTSACDDETLAFLSQYGIRIVLVLDGDRKTVVSTVTRIASGKYAHVLAGIQFGTDPTGGDDIAKWRAVLTAMARKKMRIPVALPVKDFSSPFIKRLQDSAVITHLTVDLRDSAAPFEKLQKISDTIERSTDKTIKKLRLWVLAPGRLPGTPEAKAFSPETVAWQVHWFMTAFAVGRTEKGRTDYVFFDRPYGADDFGLMLRHLWATATRTQHLFACGEAAAIVKAETASTQKDVVNENDLSLDNFESPVVEALAAAMTAGTVPTACVNVAGGRPGDLQYMALVADPDPGEEFGGRMCLLMVNTRNEKANVKVRLNTKVGGTGNGFRRRFIPDAKAGKMAPSLIERFGSVSEDVEPGEVTFLSFRY